jgi:hypothetical protein
MPVLSKLLGIDEKTEPFSDYKLATFDKDNDTYTFMDASGAAVNFTGAEVKSNPTLLAMTTKAGATIKENWTDEAHTYNKENTYASKPSMFSEAGGIWMGEDNVKYLTSGQKITLGEDFGIQNTSRTIPAGNYTATKIGGVIMLVSEDGKKAYSTNKADNSPTTTMMQQGYVWDNDLKYWYKK